MLDSILIALGLSTDSFAVAFAYSVPTQKNRFGYATFLAFAFCFFQTSLVMIGWYSGMSFLSYIATYAYLAAFLLLSYVGAKIVFDSISNKSKKIKELDLDKIVMLSLATSADGFVAGVGLGLSGIDPTVYLSAIAIFTFAITFFGAYLGIRLRHLLGRKAELFGGMVLIVFGIKILLEHTGWLAAIL